MENQQTEKEKVAKSDKKSTLRLIGAALIILSFVFLYIAFNQPRISPSVSENTSSSSPETTTGHNETVQTELAITESAIIESVITEQPKSTEGTTATNAVQSVKYPLNLNTCTAEELMTIDKIGEVRAHAIIAYREHIGGYTSVDQLKNISGIGDSIFASIKPYVTV